MQTRIDKLTASLPKYGVQALLITQPENRIYLSGYTGDSGALFITPERSYIITDFRYIEQTREQSPHLNLVKIETTLEETLAELINRLKVSTLGFEASHITYKSYQALVARITGTKFIPVEGLVENNRMVKDASELTAIEKAMSLLDEGFAHICSFIKPEMSERSIALELEVFMRQKGAEKVAFPYIVASGSRSSLPHGEASAKTLRSGEVITLDFGVVVDNYHSDMTRTIALGKPSDELKEIYNIVLKAQETGISAVKAGVPANAVDKAAREVIKAYGYGEYFGHSTGHGVGLAIHENPTVSFINDTVLQSGMVITIEPGIYLPGIGGVRIEDSLVVEENGCRLLTFSPKDKFIEL